GDVVDLMKLIRQQSPEQRQRAIRMIKAVNE
ncbi:hypothetical protein UFOVP399_1, partial [uncultured Caudovirales phage]